MALTKINSEGIKDLEVKTGDIAADAVTSAKIGDDQINSEHFAAASIDNEHIADDAVGADQLAADAVVNASIATGADIAGAKIADNAIGPNQLSGTLDLSSKTVTLPAASVQAHANNFDDNLIQSNIAMLGFKVAAANDLAKFSLVDQIIDEYEDASGIDASASTNETLASGAYSGQSTTSTTPTVSGGTITTDGDYKVHSFTSNGNYVTDTTQSIDVLVVAGGGTGGRHGGGGGGAGGLIYATNWELAAGTHAVTVGVGGDSEWVGDPGEDSSIGTLLVAKGGGKGKREAGDQSDSSPYSGGSGGGSARSTTFSGIQPTQSGDSGTYGFGNRGGAGLNDGTSAAAGGGGGAGAVGTAGTVSGSTYTGGNGGAGKVVNITGSNVTYAAGGGGASWGDPGNPGTGGSGGGGNASQRWNDGGDATGYGSGGGGGGQDSGANGGGAGSDGIVIFRRKTTFNATTYNDLTLQSTATTAEAAPTKADLIILIENAAGTATINTDVKGYISRDGSAFSSAVTFVDEGTWGTNKKVLAAHDVDISGIASGTSMKYKITTHNQGASKITKIHAASLGWR